ncbi:hypothetical protein JCM16358_22880 [Halanaerocella petrolearia]
MLKFLAGMITGGSLGFLLFALLQTSQQARIFAELSNLICHLQQASERYSKKSETTTDELLKSRYLGRVVAFKQTVYVLKDILINNQ